MLEKRIWLDCDPGHDDATAILLAIHTPGVKLVGISTVHGNTDADNTFKNALRCLYAFGADPSVLVYQGAPKPLIKPVKHDPEIHGFDGLGGVEGLPDGDHHPEIRAWADRSRCVGLTFIEAIARAVEEAKSVSEKLTVISTGPMTNIALFVSVHHDLLHGIEQFVFMGGGVGQGNRSAVAEYNILCDPEAAQIVLDTPVKKTMIPINVTHTAIVIKSIHAALLNPSSASSDSPEQPLPSPQTPLRHTLSTLISFFASSYASTFGFTNGPPLHDALTIAYVAYPEKLFRCTRHRVDVELTGTHTSGETVVDLFGYRRECDESSWGREGKNCLVADWLDVDGFFQLLLDSVDRCDSVSPLNKPQNG